MIKRYPCQIFLLFLTGILTVKGFCLQTSGLGGDGIVLSAAAAASAGMCIWTWVRREQTVHRKLRQAMILFLAFGLGAARMHASADRMEHMLAGLSDGQEVSLQGRIIKKQCKDMPGQESAAWSQTQTQSGIPAQTVSWTVCVTDSYLKASHKIRSCGDVIVYLNPNGAEPVIGNTILLSGKIKLFRTARNDGNFDERAYYQNQGYSFKIYAEDATYQVMDDTVYKIREFLYDLRQHLVQIYGQKLPEQEAGVLDAMLLGEKSMLPSETKQLYQRGGIAHILAISGLHISILGAAVLGLLRKSGIPYVWAAAASMGALFLFSQMTGMGISTGRAVIMFGIYLGAACCGRAYDSRNGLAAAGLSLLLSNPGALFLAGFQFSFAAVLGVLFGKEFCRILRPKFRLTETVCMSFGIQMLTLPLTAWYYFELPVYSILLNMVVLPFVALVLTLGLTGGSLGLLAAAAFWLNSGAAAGMVQWLMQRLSDGMLSACAVVLQYFSLAGKFCLKLPGAVYLSGQPQIGQIAGYYLIFYIYIGILYFQQKKHSRIIPEKRKMPEGKDTAADRRDVKRLKFLAVSGCLACLCLLFLRLPKPPEVSVLDVGQGDGIYIRTSDGMDIFLDGGSSDVSQAGTYRILPFLRSKGISGIDYWFLSHLDKDHISGFYELLESGFPVRQVVLADGIVRDAAYEKLERMLKQCQVPIQYLEKGAVLRGTHARFTALAPEYAAASSDRNACSLVLLYEDTGFCGLFTGDISVKEEAKLLRETSLPQVTLYKAAHHGSGYSNSAELLRQAAPYLSTVSCAEKNDYGHPGKEAVAHMAENSHMIRYTMQDGRIRIRQKKGTWQVSGYIRSDKG